jgi:hypothetical protein
MEASFDALSLAHAERRMPILIAARHFTGH